MSRIRVERTPHLLQPDVLEEAMVTWIGYVSPTDPTLMEVVEYGGQRGYYYLVRQQSLADHHPRPAVIRRSTDNGRTWQEAETWVGRSTVHGRWHLQADGPVMVHHPRGGAVVRLYRTNLEIDGLLPWDQGAPSRATGLLWSQHSADGGLTWSAPEQVICAQPGCDPTHWAPGICFGHNSGGVEGATPVLLSDDRFLLPLFSSADAPPYRFRSAGLIGQWRSDGSGVNWQVTAHATVKPEFSSDGGDEPCLAVLPDGRWLMTMRVRARPGDRLALPSGKFITTSHDEGATWSEPEPLRYTDGGQVYCPACLAHIFVAPRTGRLYLITNLLDAPTTGCDPRTALHLAELDSATLRVIRASVTIIEQRDAAAGQPETIRFSNWRRYDDRETGRPVLYMTGCPGDVGRHETCGVPPHSYRYDLILD